MLEYKILYDIFIMILSKCITMSQMDLHLSSRYLKGLKRTILEYFKSGGRT